MISISYGAVNKRRLRCVPCILRGCHLLLLLPEASRAASLLLINSEDALALPRLQERRCLLSVVTKSAIYFGVVT